VDPVASIRPCAVEVECHGWSYVVPALPAAAWIEAILDEDGAAIFPGLLEPEAYSLVMADLFAGEIEGEEIRSAARATLEAAAGREWWVADRLVRGTGDRDAWAIVHGELVLQGVDLDAISIGAFCDAVYAMVVGRLTDESARAKFDMDLNVPPTDVPIEEIYDEQQAAADFMSALGQDASMFGGSPGG
jgi:hypothetical protein